MDSCIRDSCCLDIFPACCSRVFCFSHFPVTPIGQGSWPSTLSLVLLEVSSVKGVFPVHCCLWLAPGGVVGFCLYIFIILTLFCKVT
ncbi:hypothetical protein EXN66_Car021681 [Channa argus]|uniref:Uncharacterized protein n=1 Tax=Channa argus TaxID=215402 RepID=A0A6G1QTE5_CHAAH|nr:hypothetical protein EXN66_Car021681 [Channa argus]